MEKASESQNISKVKSKVILKQTIFSLLCQHKILDLLSYNKSMQRIFGLDIEDYKKESKKYLNDEKNGKGKEYIINTNILIYEG